MSFDSTPSFSSPLAFTSILPTDQDVATELEDQDWASHSQQDTLMQESSRARSISIVSASEPSAASYKPSSSTSDKFTSSKNDPSSTFSPSKSPPIRFERQRTNSLRPTATGTSLLNVLPHSLHGSSLAEQDSASLSPHDIFTAPSSLTHKNLAASSTASMMGPPAPPPRRAPPTSVGSLEPDSQPAYDTLPISAIAAGKRKEDNLLGLGMPSNPSNLSSAPSPGAAGASSKSSSPTLVWDTRLPAGRHSSTSTFNSSASGSSHAPPRRRRFTSTSLGTSNAHRRARSLGGVLLGDTIVSPVGGPDGVDPNLIAAIESGTSTIPIPAAAASNAYRSGSIASTGTQSSTSSISASSPGRSSIPSTPSGSIRLLRKQSDLLNVLPDARALTNTYQQMSTPPDRPASVSLSPSASHLIQDDDAAAKLPPPPLPTPSLSTSSAVPIDYGRARVRSQTLGQVQTPPNASSMSNQPLSAAPDSSTSLKQAPALADAIRLQRVPTAVRLAGDLIVPPTPSPRLNSKPSPSHEAHLSRSDKGSTTSAPSSSNMSHPSGHGLGIGGLGNEAANSSKLNVPQTTPNATRSNSPFASDRSQGLSSKSNSGRSSPLAERASSKVERIPFSGGGDRGGQSLSVSIPSSKHFAPTASLPGSAILGSRSPTLSRTLARTSSDSQQNRSLSSSGGTSAYSPLLSISSVQTSPSAERKSLTMGRALRRSWGAQELVDNLANSDEQEADVPAGWPIASQSSALPRDQTPHGNFSSSIGAGATLDMPGPSSRFLAPYNSHLLTPGSVSSSSQPLSGIDEYARIIIQSRNAKMQKWKSQHPRAPTVTSSKSQDFLIARAADLTSPHSSSLGLTRRDTTIGIGHYPAPPSTPGPSRRGSMVDSKDVIEFLCDQDADDSNLDLDSAFSEFEWVDWLDEYRKMKEAKLRSEQQDSQGGESNQALTGNINSAPKYGGEAEPKSRRLLGPSKELFAIDTRRSVSDPLARHSAIETSVSKRKDPVGSQNIEGNIMSQNTIGSERPMGRSAGKYNQLGGVRRPSAAPVRGPLRRPVADARRSFSMASLNTSEKASAALNISPIRRLAVDRPLKISLSPVTSRVTGSASYTGVGSSSTSPSTQQQPSKRKQLGGKIEAWWSAVKSGFSGQQTTDPWTRGQQVPATRAPISALSASLQRTLQPLSQAETVSYDSKNSSALLSLPTEQDSWGQNPFARHTRAHTGTIPPKASESIHTLRASFSAHNLLEKVPPGVKNTTPSSQSFDHPSSTTSSRASTETTGQDSAKKRHHPKLSLQLEKGFSTFDADAFEHIGKSNPSSFDSPLGSARSKESTSSRKRQSFSTQNSLAETPPHSASTNEQGSELSERRQLSHPWKPHEPSSLSAKNNSFSLADKGGATSQDESDHEGKRGRGRINHGPSSKDFTIHSIHQHIKHRLAASKESCDRELRKIVAAINTFVELDLERQEDELQQAMTGDDPDVDEVEEIFSDDNKLLRQLGLGDSILCESVYLDSKIHDSDAISRQASTSSAVGFGAEGSDSTKRQREAHETALDPDETTQALPSGSLFDYPRLGVQNENVEALGTMREYKLPAPPPATHNFAAQQLVHKSSSNMPRPSKLNPLGRTKSMTRSTRSASNSRSTSRSHSPMPGAFATSNLSTASSSPRLSPARRMRPLPLEENQSQSWVPPLEGLVTLAMEVVDTSIHSLIARHDACSQIISNVQSVGRIWDEHPEWPGRGWYVQLLLAVAGLSRVVEWWEAEKGFWNFNDEGEQDAEPIRFILGGHPIEGEADSRALPHAWSQSASSSPTRARAATLSLEAAASTSGTNSPALDSKGEAMESVLTDTPTSPTENGGEGDTTIVEAPRTGDEDWTEKKQGEIADVGTYRKVEGVNVLMELSLEGQHFLYLSPAWKTVIGSDPSELYDVSISDLLAPSDINVFAEASRQLEANESHTVEVVFHLRVEKSALASSSSLALTEGDEDDGICYFQEMEGKGMLMQDRQTGLPSHSMWVFKPAGPPEPEADLPETVIPRSSRSMSTFLDDPTATVAHIASISTEPLLCRICERDIPTWFFEKHSEICNEVHRLEMEIGECNENLHELRKTAKDFVFRLDQAGSQMPEPPVEYRGLALTTPPASTHPPSALEGINKSIFPRQPNAANVRKAHLRALDTAIEVLQVACEISTPAIKEEYAQEPIEKQRLLSPSSENRVVTVQQWRRNLLDDPALDMLMADVEVATRGKLSAINRMLNTIVYVEKVREEWEERVEAALAAVAEEDEGSEDTESPQGSLIEESQMTDESTESLQVASTTQSMHALQIEATPQVSESLLNPTTRNASGKDQNGVEEEDDGIIAPGLLLERDEREDLPLPQSTLFSATPGLGAEDDDEIPAVDSDMGGSSHLAPIPIPRNTTLASKSQKSDKGIVSPTCGMQSRENRSKSRSRRSSHLPSDNGLLQTPPLSPYFVASESLGASLKTSRRLSVSHRSPMVGSIPLSPRIPPVAPSSKPTASSIKDFDIIKPISKGAFGSVFLAKKCTTGDYYAIKVLKKSDMIAKNQITNVKAERMILMTQTQSPFVVKLFFTFQSSEYLYLVMEYLPGGDCASLCKVLGGLPEEWARQYIAEVVVGLEHLHSKGVVHRDLKPDNLLIDQKGHLKLTDFGLSKIGLLGRQTRQTTTGNHVTSPMGNMRETRSDSLTGSLPSSAASVGSNTRNPSISTPAATTTGETAASFSPTMPGLAGMMRNQPFFVAPQRGRIVSSSTDISDSSESESYPNIPKPLPLARMDSPGQAFGAHLFLNEALGNNGSDGAQPKRLVGTPDYLAPESILGIGMDDFAVDWWALGVILYEFSYGYPPFHAETPEKVFDNILSRRIDWEEDAMEVSPEARDLMELLMCTDPKQRLGSCGSEEIKKHPFFEGIDWQNVTAEPGPFVPQVTDPESTDYFDLRGAVLQEFDEDHAPKNQEFAKAVEGKRILETGRPLSRMRNRLERNQASNRSQPDDFGNFSFKNLPVLKQANDEVIRKMREDQLPALAKAMEQSMIHSRHRSLSGKGRTQRIQSQTVGGPPSPAQSVSSHISTPSRSTAPTSPSGLFQTLSHRRRPSELAHSSSASGSATAAHVGVSAAAGVMDRKRNQLVEADSSVRRNSMPSRLRTKSVGLTDRPALPANWHEMKRQAAGSSQSMSQSPTTSNAPTLMGGTLSNQSEPPMGVDAIECLVAEDNPISLRMLENILIKVGCRCTAVRNGAEAVRLAMADTKYSVLFIDVTLPIVNGQDVARMVKSTRNVNTSTPIVALASFDRGDPIDPAGSVFDAVLAKPLERVDVCAILSRLGFTSMQAPTCNQVEPAAAAAHPPTPESNQLSFGGNNSRNLSRKSTVAGCLLHMDRKDCHSPPGCLLQGGGGGSGGASGAATASSSSSNSSNNVGGGGLSCSPALIATPYSSSPLGSSVFTRNENGTVISSNPSRGPPTKPTSHSTDTSFMAASAALNKAISDLSLE